MTTWSNMRYLGMAKMLLKLSLKMQGLHKYHTFIECLGKIFVHYCNSACLQIKCKSCWAGFGIGDHIIQFNLFQFLRQYSTKQASQCLDLCSTEHISTWYSTLSCLWRYLSWAKPSTHQHLNYIHVPSLSEIGHCFPYMLFFCWYCTECLSLHDENQS